MNLSSLAPYEGRRSLVFEDFIEYEGLSPNDALSELRANKLEFGKFKFEFCKVENSFLALPVGACFLREKVRLSVAIPLFFSSRHQRFHSIFVILQVYNIAVLFQTSAEGPLQVTSKVAARGGVPRKRMATYAMDDFIRMSAVPLTSPRARLGQVTDIISLRSRHFNLFEISSTRAESFSFTRKRFLTSDGNSTPFHYYRNDELNRKDCIKRKRARRCQIADP